VCVSKNGSVETKCKVFTVQRVLKHGTRSPMYTRCKNLITVQSPKRLDSSSRLDAPTNPQPGSLKVTPRQRRNTCAHLCAHDTI